MLPVGFTFFTFFKAFLVYMNYINVPNKKWEVYTIFVKHFEAICGYFFNFENIVFRSVNCRCKWSKLLAAFVDSADSYYFMLGYIEVQLYGLKPVFIVSSEFSSDWNILQSITWPVQVLTSPQWGICYSHSDFCTVL